MKKTGKRFSNKIMALLLAVLCIGLLFSQIASAEEADTQIGQETLAEGSYVVDDAADPAAEEAAPEVPAEPVPAEAVEEQLSEEVSLDLQEEPVVISEQFEDVEEMISE